MRRQRWNRQAHDEITRMQWRARGVWIRNVLAQSIAVVPATVLLAMTMWVIPIPIALLMSGLFGSVIAQALELWWGIDIFCPHLGWAPDEGS
jgi:hypothetical protein